MSSERPSDSIVPLGIYLHFPFCVSHCTYCDFYTRSFPGGEPAGEFTRALAVEIGASAAELGIAGRIVDTVYLGGGTPSLMESADLDRALGAIEAAFRIDPDSEISLEANPESVTGEKLRAYRERGVNRLSLGVQSFQEPILRTLGRAHTPERAEAAIRDARRSGFENLSLDLMLALPGQSASSLKDDLERALRLDPDHLSCYLLEMDKETALRSRIEKGELAAPSEEEAAGMYDLARSTLAGAGYRHYEISSFARPGKESRHNLKYWTDAPFAGFGPSAYSYLQGRRFRVARDLEDYLRSAAEGVPPLREEDSASPEVRCAEAIFAGLRLTDGIDLEAACRRHLAGDYLAKRLPGILELEEAGLIHREGSRIRLTPRAFPVANEVFRAFL